MSGQELYDRLGAMTEEERRAIVLCRPEDGEESFSEVSYRPTSQSGIVTVMEMIVLS